MVCSLHFKGQISTHLTHYVTCLRAQRRGKNQNWTICKQSYKQLPPSLLPIWVPIPWQDGHRSPVTAQVKAVQQQKTSQVSHQDIQLVRFHHRLQPQHSDLFWAGNNFQPAHRWKPLCWQPGSQDIWQAAGALSTVADTTCLRTGFIRPFRWSSTWNQRISI